MPEDKVARALGSKVRRNVLRLFKKNDGVSVNGVADLLNISEPSAFRHAHRFVKRF